MTNRLIYLIRDLGDSYNVCKIHVIKKYQFPHVMQVFYLEVHYDVNLSFENMTNEAIIPWGTIYRLYYVYETNTLTSSSFNSASGAWFCN